MYHVCLGKTQVMGEIKIALKKEMKTEGEHLVLEILQCRNITYKFKTPDHLPGILIIMINKLLTSHYYRTCTAIISARDKESYICTNLKIYISIEIPETLRLKFLNWNSWNPKIKIPKMKFLKPWDFPISHQVDTLIIIFVHAYLLSLFSHFLYLFSLCQLTSRYFLLPFCFCLFFSSII